MKPLLLKISFLIMGLSSTVAQVLLLRELLISFLGNELTLGIILGNWLILVAFGSVFAAKFVERVKRKMEVFVMSQLSFSVALPFTVYLSRVFKNMLLVTPGEGLGFATIFYSSFLILLPVAFPLGGLFTFGCNLYSHYVKEDVSSVGKVYVLESIGAMIGGLLITFLLIQYFNSFEIAFIVSLTNTLLSTLLLWPKFRFSRNPFQMALWVIPILLSFLLACSLLPRTSNAIHQSSIHSQWRNLNVIHSENSIYGNITVTKRGEQFTFFANGAPSITTPVPDVAAVEDFVHFPMLFHENPESVLILSGGAGGMIHEILKYPVSCVDYVELDPLLLRLIQKFSTPLTQAELWDRRVRIHYADGRLFVRKTQHRFDMIFIGIPVPQELQTNRLFSFQFFATAREKMNPDGIVALTLPGSLTYISPELRDLNTCLLNTLKNVFRSVRVVPGDVNLYLASNSSQLKKLTADEIIKRFEQRKIQTSLFTKGYIEYRLHERWTKWFLKSVEGKEIQINSDLRPVAVLLSLSYWNALFSPYLTGIFNWFEGFSVQISLALLTLFTLLIGAAFLMKTHLARQAIPYVIFTTGLAGMIFNLAIVFTFQTFYGYLYHQIGMLIATFMFGVALSSFLITQRLDRIRRDSILLLTMEIGIILFSLLFPFVFSVPSQHLETPTASFLIYGMFLVMSFLSGVCIGLQFPLATRIYLGAPEKREALGHAAGLLYGADLLGGFLGGLFGGVLLLPILGLKESCLVTAMLKISSGLLFLLFMKIRRAE